METRTIEETKLYYLSLQHILEGKIRPIVAFDDLTKLEDWMKSQKQEWTDLQEDGTKIRKKFKKGSLLEWYLPPKTIEPTEQPMMQWFIGFQWTRKNVNDEQNPYDLRIPFNPTIPCTQ